MFRRLLGILIALTALLWFLMRVIPKPSRASYPCQRAAFPIAAAFILWLAGSLVGVFRFVRRPLLVRRYRLLAAGIGGAVALVCTCWLIRPLPSVAGAATPYDFVPQERNVPRGTARGINPGRVVWTHDPSATKWSGHRDSISDQWWTDANTDQDKIDAMLATSLRLVTSAASDEQAWQGIFRYYNQVFRGLDQRGYQPGEIVAVKININSSGSKLPNVINVSPQMTLAMVRQLVYQAHVPPGNIIVYDAQRNIYPAVLLKVWGEFKDVRFIQADPPAEPQPKNPGYGNYHGLEPARWVEGVTYSSNDYKNAKLIPRQILESTYLVNLAILKGHSYPYASMEGGDEGQTGVTMCGKNHFGSIKGTPELHAAINTNQQGKKNAYSPIVDLAASPNLGAKTILYVLDGLYCGRRHQSFPLHFPNPPFNNRVAPYENPDWPASVLASQDGVALDSVGLDILYSQTKNNNDPENGDRPRILIRENADDYLREMAQADSPPSGTVYTQGGKKVASLGVFEHWNSDTSRLYSRNLDRINSKGIELLYVPMGSALPGRGLAQHPFLYCGEWQAQGKSEQTMYVVRDGKVAWSYTIARRDELGDCTMLLNGNIVFSRRLGASEVTPDKRIVWNYDAPPKTEIHTTWPIGTERVLIMQNGNPAKLMVINKSAGRVEKELILQTGKPNSVHAQFRHVRMTKAGTFLVAHLDMNKVVEYDPDGKEIWSVPAPSAWAAVRLENGNTLISGNEHGYVREVNSNGKTVWEINRNDLPGITLETVQEVDRLANGNTVICNWAGFRKLEDWPTVVQVIEVTADKKVVWALRDWTLGPASAIQLLDEPGIPENGDLQR